MSKLLIQDNPIMILPSLVQKVGLNEAIVLQQIHYWLLTSKHEKEGRKWIYNSYTEWQSQFPFWSTSTIKRTVRSLEENGYIETANYNRAKMDRTKWYSIDYEKIKELDIRDETNLDSSCGQADPAKGSDWTSNEVMLTRAIPEINTKTSTENIYTPLPISEIITYLNQKTNANYKSSSRKTIQLIQSRWNEGFRLDDFKKVIDVKTEEWLTDPMMGKFLRPETLFGTKFESYMNQKSGKKVYNEEDFNLDD